VGAEPNMNPDLAARRGVRAVSSVAGAGAGVVGVVCGSTASAVTGVGRGVVSGIGHVGAGVGAVGVGVGKGVEAVEAGVQAGVEVTKPVVKGMAAMAVDGVRGAAQGAVKGAVKGAVNGMAAGAQQGASAGGLAGLVAGSCGGFLVGSLRGCLAGAVAGAVTRVSVRIRKISELSNYREECLVEGQFRPLGSAFVAFTDLRSAITATKVQHTKDVDSLVVSRCPEPRDIVWENIGMPLKLRQLRQLAITGVSFYMVCFMMVPVAFVASLANLDNLARVFPLLTSYLEHHPSTKGFIQGFLPSLVLALFVNQVPNVLPFLAKLEGIPSRSAIDSWVLSKFFFFQIVNVFLGVTLSTGTLAIIQILVERPISIVLILGTSVPRAASFFVNYVCFQSLATFPLELFQLEELLHAGAKWRSATSARERRAALAPPHFSFGEDGPKHLLVFLVACVYSVINPLILPLSGTPYEPRKLAKRALFNQPTEPCNPALLFSKAVS